MTMSAVDAEKGNLGEVRSALAGRAQHGQIVDYAGHNDMRAEVLPGAEAKWYVIETHPGEDRIAAAHLIARRFGVYMPEREVTDVRRGRKVDVRRALFPGYLFVFVWDVEAHFSRIIACPGVRGMVMMNATSADDDCSYRFRGGYHPVTVADEVIDRIRFVENCWRPMPLADGTAAAHATRKKRRRRKHYVAPDVRNNTAEQPTIVGSRPWSVFADGLTALDGDGRNQALRDLLGLSS